MAFAGSRGGAGALGPADVAQFAPRLLQQRLERLPHEAPRSHVARLLLRPYYVGRGRVALDDPGRLVRGERIKLFHPRQRHVFRLPLAARGEYVVVDLAGAENHARDALVLAQFRVAQNLQKPSGGELPRVRNRLRMPQQALGREDRQWLAHAAPVVAAVHLAAQQVEVLRGRGAIGHLHVVLGAEREIPLDARAGMFRPLALVAVREQQHQAAGLAPFRFGAGNELVDHDLRAVGEIAELRFPNHQRQRVRHAVAELETQHGVLAEGTVVHVETPLVRGNVLQGDIALAGFGIVERQVALAEGAAAGILAAEPYRRAFQRQRAERQRLGKGPVDGGILLQRGAAAVHEPAQLGMQVKLLREIGDAPDHALQHRAVHRGARAEAGDLLAGHRAQFLRFVMFGATLRGIEGVGKPLRGGFTHPRGLLRGDYPFPHQALRIQRAYRRVLLDLAVQDGLRVARVVAFIVAVAPVADHVDHHVLLELLAVI